MTVVVGVEDLAGAVRDTYIHKIKRGDETHKAHTATQRPHGLGLPSVLQKGGWGNGDMGTAGTEVFSHMSPLVHNVGVV